ncbi:DUF6941 family protein [Mycobacteroides abscessus]|uniref:DUF6941 family protein n=1 Tax=Mycobacteroides abscessus TaxID=36809 RepID=UPI0009A58B1E|nr:hypothetical protein [Mycobacteroides abscessus]SKQ12498.1 Uncharacterised protein [Mycobacteroides abscessus subsp. massiliense]
MAQLDYAFLAEHAAIQEGKLTVVGASFTKAIGGTFLFFYVAGRIRADEGHEPFELSIEMVPPGDEPEVRWATSLSEGGAHARYDNKVAYLFALRTAAKVETKGLYHVNISLDGLLVRHLAFEAVEAVEAAETT